MKRPLSKQQLAKAYMSDLAPHSAVNQLMSWIHNSPSLLKKLITTGYRKTQKMLTGEQVEIITEAIGEP